MARQRKPRPSAASARAPAQPPTFGWIPQPPPPTNLELIQSGVYENFGVTRELLEARDRLRAHMRDPATIERAAFERRAGRVGPEMLVGTFIGQRIKNRRRTRETCVVALVRRKVTDHERICESCRLHEM